MAVRTTTGVTHIHLLDLGSGKRSAIQGRMRAKIIAVEKFLDGGTAVTFENPTITYNGSHIESVGYDVSGASAIAAQLREEMADARRTVGFGRPSAPGSETNG